jgi:hypothetical protein
LGKVGRVDHCVCCEVTGQEFNVVFKSFRSASEAYRTRPTKTPERRSSRAWHHLWRVTQSSFFGRPPRLPYTCHRQIAHSTVALTIQPTVALIAHILVVPSRLDPPTRMPPIRSSRNRKPPPDGFEDIEDTLLEFSNKLKDAENASHEGKKKHEMVWPVFQITHQRT